MARHVRGTGRLFRRSQSPFWWLAYYHRGKEVRESSRLEATPANRSKVEKMLRERTRQAGTPQFTGPAEYRVTFDDLAALHLADYRKQRRRSLRDAERIVRRLTETFGGWPALDVTTQAIEQYTEARQAAGAQPATINRELSALRHMFRLATKRNAGDPLRLTTRPHVPMLDESENVREGFVEPADFEAIAAHLPADVADVARFAYLSAWRRGEVLTLEWRRVRLTQDGGTIDLSARRSKNKKGRTLPLRGPLLDLIQQRASMRRLDCPLVFHRNGQPIRDFRRVWANACRESGYAGTLFHDLRRSGVRNLIRSGVPQAVAQRISGHRTAATFARYNITDESDLADAIERVGAYVTERRGESPVVEPLRAAAAAQEHGHHTDTRGPSASRARAARSQTAVKPSAEEGNRTPKPLRAADFESAASASSATSARARTIAQGAPGANGVAGAGWWRPPGRPGGRAGVRATLGGCHRPC